jgi:N4-gp56 family major capsid protein
MSTITTSNVLPEPVQQWFDDVLLAREEPNLIHGTFAMEKNLPSRNSKTVRYRRYNNLKTATVPLSPNGLTPAGQLLSAVDIDATVDWYGDYITITDQVMYVNQDPVLNETASLLGQAAKETRDELIRNMMQSTASRINFVNGGGIDNPTPYSGVDLDQIVNELIGNKARMITEPVEGTLKFGTGPIRASYWAMMHSDLIPDLESITGFIAATQYPSHQVILKNEWGSYKNLRFLYTQDGIVEKNASLNGQDVYITPITGLESYACIALDNMSLEFLYYPAGSPTDPLKQRNTAGYKMAMVPRLLNDAWLINGVSTRGI